MREGVGDHPCLAVPPPPPSLLTLPPLVRWHTLWLICQCAGIIGAGHAWCVRDRMSRWGPLDGERDERRGGGMTDESRSTKDSGTQKRDGGETGGLKVLGRKGDKDGKKGSSERGISTRRQIEGDYVRMPMLHTLSPGVRAARWLLTQHKQTHTHTHAHTRTQRHVARKTCWATAATWVIVSISPSHNTHLQTYCAARALPLKAFWHFPDRTDRIWGCCRLVLRRWGGGFTSLWLVQSREREQGS